MKCGVNGHKVANCQATAEDVKVFARRIERGGSPTTVVLPSEGDNELSQ